MSKKMFLVKNGKSKAIAKVKVGRKTATFTFGMGTKLDSWEAVFSKRYKILASTNNIVDAFRMVEMEREEGVLDSFVILVYGEEGELIRILLSERIGDEVWEVERR